MGDNEVRIIELDLNRLRSKDESGLETGKASLVWKYDKDNELQYLYNLHTKNVYNSNSRSLISSETEYNYQNPEFTIKYLPNLYISRSGISIDRVLEVTSSKGELRQEFHFKNGRLNGNDMISMKSVLKNNDLKGSNYTIA